MANMKHFVKISVVASFLLGCFVLVFYFTAYSSPPDDFEQNYEYVSRLPESIDPTGEKIVIIDPKVHAWGAYDPEGDLVAAGLATAGADWCSDIRRACRTKAGTFRVFSLGSVHCKSSIFPIPRGGAPMPYCMFFNRNQAMHGSHGKNVIEGNASHGCVRLRIEDAEWLRKNFVDIGTMVTVYPY